MVDLTRIPVAVPQPMAGSEGRNRIAAIDLGLGPIASLMGSAEGARNANDKAALKAAEDAAVGAAVGGLLEETRDTLVTSVNQRIVDAKIKEAAESGVEITQQGAADLYAAQTDQTRAEYLMSTGQYDTYAQMRMLERGIQFIDRNPALAKDYVELSKSATTGANSLFQRQETTEQELAKARRSRAEETMHNVLVERNQWYPGMSKEQEAEVFNTIVLPEKQKLQQKAERVVEIQQDQAIELSEKKKLVAKELDALGNTPLQAVLDRVGAIRNSGGSKEQRLAQLDKAWAAEMDGANKLFPDPAFEEEKRVFLTQRAEIYQNTRDWIDGTKEKTLAATEDATLQLKAKQRLAEQDPGYREAVQLISDVGPLVVQIAGEAGSSKMAQLLTPSLEYIAQRSAGQNPPAPTGTVAPPGVDPKTVPQFVQGQTQTAAQTLVGMSELAKSGKVTPAIKEAIAIQGVTFLTDEGVKNNSVARAQYVAAMADPRTVELFKDNAYAQNVAAAVGNQYNEFHQSVETQFIKLYKKPIGELIVFKREGDRVVVAPAPGSPVSRQAAFALTTEYNNYFRAMTHSQGKTDYNELLDLAFGKK